MRELSGQFRGPHDSYKLLFRCRTCPAFPIFPGAAQVRPLNGGWFLNGGFFFQPQTQILSHRLNNFVAGIIAAISHVARAGAELRGVIFGASRRIEFIALPTQMKYGGFGLLVKVARVPIAWDSAADSDSAAQTIRMGEDKLVVQRA